jgi:hypothetical protein
MSPSGGQQGSAFLNRLAADKRRRDAAAARRAAAAAPAEAAAVPLSAAEAARRAAEFLERYQRDAAARAGRLAELQVGAGGTDGGLLPGGRWGQRVAVCVCV